MNIAELNLESNNEKLFEKKLDLKKIQLKWPIDKKYLLEEKISLINFGRLQFSFHSNAGLISREHAQILGYKKKNRKKI